MKWTINPDLQNERQSSVVNSEEFAEWWAGGREKLHERRALEKLFFDDPEFDDPLPIAYMSHKELYEHSMKKGIRFLSKLLDWQKQQPNYDRNAINSLRDFRIILSGRLGTGLFPQNIPLRLHYSMFLPALLGQSNEEQKREWLDKSWRMQGIVGTYAQTELGHGTYIRGLETRADYDIEREEFVLNTPTLSSYKFWPGGLGQVVNMVVLMAQLYIKGKHYGLYPFLVRIRDEETHMPLPGVDVGEIGPKVGVNGVCNGFLGLKNIRIPRTQMLMKHATVLKDGTFKKVADPIMSYATMVYVRTVIVRDASFYLLLASTIATRYSAVRRQSPIDPNQPEPKIIEHLTQQAKVFPQIAKGVFFTIAADYVWNMYETVMKEMESGNRRNLPELHALSCCLKSICTHESSQGIEILRRACGGHGFLASTNFTEIYGSTAAACVYEGENTILLLQTSRFLVKTFFAGWKRQRIPKNMVYLLNNRAVEKWNGELSSLVKMLEITAAAKVRSVFEEQLKTKKEVGSEEMAANLTSIKAVQAATLHGRAFLVRIACEKVERLKKKVKSEIYMVLNQMLEIFVISTFLDSLGEVLLIHPLKAKHVNEIQQRYEYFLKAFRRNAVAVVDGFDFHDRVLASTLGSYDGRAYERLMEEAKKSPLNQEPVNSTFHTHLKPFMQGKL